MTLGTALLIIGVSAAPIAELRGGIPLAISQGCSPTAAFLLAVVGNLLVVLPLLFGLEAFERVLLRWRISRRLLEWVLARARKKSRWVEHWGPIGLILLVAIPLPGTGAWTGSIVARLLGIDPRKAFPWIAVGVLIAGILVLLASVGALHLVGIE